MTFYKRSFIGLLTLCFIFGSHLFCEAQHFNSTAAAHVNQQSRNKVNKNSGFAEAIPKAEQKDLTQESQTFLQQPRADAVKGKVTAEKDNTPLAGATITIKGKNRSVVSDANGNFQINATSTDVLIVEYINYAPREVPVNGQSVVNVSLTQKETNIGEVVVTALGITKQSRSLGYSAT
ncbi:MAG: carboxypeptidase-like regulatory domain-containing protein, partial [Bacteroidota bacterium]|nr:carboxypeptidase-like regulatory domain-containing protein [Bacteroidota bacterium]